MKFKTGTCKIDLIVKSSKLPDIDVIEGLYKIPKIKKIYADAPNEFKIQIESETPAFITGKGMRKLKQQIYKTICKYKKVIPVTPK